MQKKNQCREARESTRQNKTTKCSRTGRLGIGEIRKRSYAKPLPRAVNWSTQAAIRFPSPTGVHTTPPPRRGGPSDCSARIRPVREAKASTCKKKRKNSMQEGKRKYFKMAERCRWTRHETAASQSMLCTFVRRRDFGRECLCSCALREGGQKKKATGGFAALCACSPAKTAYKIKIKIK